MGRLCKAEKKEMNIYHYNRSKGVSSWAAEITLGNYIGAFSTSSVEEARNMIEETVNVTGEFCSCNVAGFTKEKIKHLKNLKKKTLKLLVFRKPMSS